tara:strand:- start:209 stop:670 length:462 start_codon:yes stop_codon:yes gene_type:complete
MDPEMIGWFKVNWSFGLALLALTYALCYWKKARSGIFSLAVLYFLLWGAWSLISNNLLSKWGISALNAWTLGEWQYGLPNIDLTILGWITFGFMLVGAYGLKDEHNKQLQKELEAHNKKTEQKMTEKSSTDEVLETNERKDDPYGSGDLFDDI